MNTIHEIPNGDLNGNQPKASASTTSTSTNLSANTASTSSSCTSTNNSSGSSSTAQPDSATGFNSNGASDNKIAKDHVDELKIIGHIKNIEKIAEKRRIFLNSTISEYSVDEKVETETKTLNGNVVEETRTHTRAKGVDHVDAATAEFGDGATPTTKYATLPKSPVTPPPKPPMLSRTRSLGVGDSRTPTGSQPQSRTSTPNATPTVQSEVHTSLAAAPTPPSPPVTSVTVKAKTVPEAIKVETVQLREDESVAAPRRIERPMSLSPEAPKQISVNHYERLIEELRCPGCAYPMKSPILLCKTGHSVCLQCTRVLLLCPLCKEPFTNLRSLTVEALCSKAHFRCTNSSGGCTVRLQIDLLGWHEKQCIYKPMKCFMGRVWGDCQWTGREAFWKEHLEKEHTNKVFASDTTDLIWNMGVQQKPLTGYYVFIVFDEMFNFYEVYDKERVLFTMACTSTVREKKHNYAFEVTMIHQDNDALAMTHKYPVHSEYDADILAEGTCVSIPLTDLAKFIDEDKLLHYRVRVLELKSPRRLKNSQRSTPSSGMHPIDFQQTQIEGVNLKAVPNDVIVTRKLDDMPYAENSAKATPKSAARSSAGVSAAEGETDKLKSLYSGKFSSNDSGSDSDPELDAFIAKKWGTPQMHFNRKFLKNNSNDSSSADGSCTLTRDSRKLAVDDRVSISSTSTSYKKRMANTLRKSFRSFKAPHIFNKKPSVQSTSNM